MTEAIRAPFFVSHGLQLYETPTALGNGLTWHGLRPARGCTVVSGQEIGGVTLNLETERRGRIARTTLCLDHAWIAAFATRPKAGRLSTDFLRWALSPADCMSISALLAEIDKPEIDGGGPGDDLPQFPSPGYRSYLGYQEVFEQELVDCDLRIANRNWHRRDAASAAPPGYDSETSWLWITVSRRQLPP